MTRVGGEIFRRIIQDFYLKLKKIFICVWSCYTRQVLIRVPLIVYNVTQDFRTEGCEEIKYGE